MVGSASPLPGLGLTSHRPLGAWFASGTMRMLGSGSWKNKWDVIRHEKDGRGSCVASRGNGQLLPMPRRSWWQSWTELKRRPRGAYEDARMRCDSGNKLPSTGDCSHSEVRGSNQVLQEHIPADRRGGGELWRIVHCWRHRLFRARAPKRRRRQELCLCKWMPQCTRSPSPWPSWSPGFNNVSGGTLATWRLSMPAGGVVHA